jgi:hypothetical protein
MSEDIIKNKEKNKSLKNIGDIKDDDDELKEELKEWEVESTEAGD